MTHVVLSLDKTRQDQARSGDHSRDGLLTCEIGYRAAFSSQAMECVPAANQEPSESRPWEKSEADVESPHPPMARAGPVARAHIRSSRYLLDRYGTGPAVK